MVVLSYKSVRFIKVENWKLALLHYCIQFSLLLYVIVYSIVIEKGYQEYEDLVGSVSLKVKGVGQSEATGFVWDSDDLVRPPIEEDAVFITTTLIETSQTRSICDADPYTGLNDKFHCTKEDFSNCTAGGSTANGITTGTCGENGMCQIHAWCPLENDTAIERMDGVGAWTIYAKADVSFPMFGADFTNSPLGLSNVNNTFQVDDILKEVGTSYEDIKAQKKSGAIIIVSMKYDCDLNHDRNVCEPTISYERLDGNNGPDTMGFNYRYQSKKIVTNGNETRNLYKLNGLRLIFRLHGQAGKFSIIPLMLALGSGLGLLSVATILCDFILEYCAEAKEKYKNYKFHNVHEPLNSGSRLGEHMLTDSTDPDESDEESNVRAPHFQF